MIAEILSTGDEIMTGALVDTNAAHIAGKLVEIGIPATRKSCVGDDLQQLVAVLQEIGKRADIAIMTGGLGPTADDLTAEAVAAAAGVPLEFSPQADQSIKQFFRSRNRSEKRADQKQAMLPEGSVCMPNPVGTAPGFWMKISRCRVFCVPGVPAEMKYLLTHSILPEVEKLVSRRKNRFLIRKMSLFGLPESVVGDRLRGFEGRFSHVKLGLRASFPIIQIRLYASGADPGMLAEQLDLAGNWVVDQLDAWIFSRDGRSMEEEIGRLLIAKQATLGVAESCTGGLISHMLTNVPGSSAFFLFSGVVYANQVKQGVLQVSADTLAQHGAVSEPVVKEMAGGARRISGADYGVATSGIAGPDGGTPEKPVGTVCIGLATPERTVARTLQLSFGDRLKNKTIFAVAALELLRRELSEARYE